MPLQLKTEALSWLTPYEERIIEAIIENGDVRTAASELKIAKSTVYDILRRVKLKLVKSQNTVNKINVVKKKSHTLRRLLVPIQKVTIPEAEVEENAEIAEMEIKAQEEEW